MTVTCSVLCPNLYQSTHVLQVNIFTDPQLLEGRLTEDEIIAFRNRFIPLAVLPVFDFPFGFEGRYVHHVLHEAPMK